jgi:OPA family glycerol-3-phosphate transporter-like MFS transporter
MIGFLRPPRHSAPLPDDQVRRKYTRLRWQVYIGIFVGYAGYYLVRKNFSLAMPHLIDEGYSRTELGFALSGVAIAYGGFQSSSWAVFPTAVMRGPSWRSV